MNHYYATIEESLNDQHDVLKEKATLVLYPNQTATITTWNIVLMRNKPINEQYVPDWYKF